ncbi:SNF2-related protein [Cytophagaceae bacterium ABcell3]|nr:SNF2-related protein [Cytophagaceae bacterium ABcell3]
MIEDLYVISSAVELNTPKKVFKEGKALFDSLQKDITSQKSEYGYHVYLPANKSDFNKVEFECYKHHYNCNCLDFFNKDYCKHVVAAIFFMTKYIMQNEDYFEEEEECAEEEEVEALLPRLNDRISSEPATLKIPKKLKNFYFLYPLVSQHIYGLSLKHAYVEKSSLVLEIGSDIFSRIQEHKVRLSADAKYLKICCTCEESVEGFCKHESVAVVYLIQNCQVDILKQLIPENLKKLQDETLKKFNLEDKAVEADNYVKLIFAENEIVGVTHKKAEGLYPLDTFEEVFNSQVRDICTPEQKQQLQLAPLINKGNQELRVIGYVLSLNPMSQSFHLKIIQGKPNKTKDKITAHVSELKSIGEYSGEVTDELKEIFILKEQLDSMGNHVPEPDNPEFAALFEKTKEVFEYLKQQAFVFYTIGRYNSYKELRKSDLNTAQIVSLDASLYFELNEESEFYKLEAFLQIDKETKVPISEVEMKHPFIGCFKPNQLLQTPTFQQGQFFHLADFQTFHTLIFFKNYPVQRCHKKDIDSFFEKIVNPLQSNYKVAVKKTKSKKKPIPLTPDKKRLYVTEFDKFVVFKPEVIYEEGDIVGLFDAGSILKNNNGKFTEYLRDEEFEKDYEELLRGLHPSFKTGGRQGFFYLSPDDMVKNFWFLNAFEKLKKQKVEVWGLNELKNFKYSVHRPQVKVHMSSQKDWFDTKIDISFGDTSISIKDLKKAIQNDENYVLLGDGTYGLLPQQWMEKFRQLFRAGKEDGEKLKVSKLNFSLLDQLADPQIHKNVLEELAEKKEKLQAFKGIEKVKVPKEIKAELRNYQKEGLNWLNFLDEFRWGGILADDMGLGKTLQIITFLQLQRNQKKGINLVIAPTSLLFNWQDELKKFAPELKFLLHYGNDRKASAKSFGDYDLIITSYGIVCNDLDQFKKINFNYIVLDESQAIKNIVSLRNKAVCSLKANNRIALTGTPVENSALELYAQMNFVNPGFLHTAKNFKDNYVKPIETNNDQNRADELKSRIAPFILRRTKKEVLTELPDKTEEVVYCMMPEEQRKVYDAFRNKYRNKLLGIIEEEGVNKNMIQVLEGLTKLRQICDSPQLLEKENLETSASIKIAELKRHIAEKTGDHKILIFSQFVKMLKLIEKELEEMDVDFEYLDGKTPQTQRAEKVRRFQNNKSCRVFLISLKAGGVGLNLTEADYVYIVDPWWNPAVENQAIDRCYRMGQKKNVTALRMICKDTVEEKIFELQLQKKTLSDNLLDSSSDGISRNLTKEDIEKLFS